MLHEFVGDCVEFIQYTCAPLCTCSQACMPCCISKKKNGIIKEKLLWNTSGLCFCVCECIWEYLYSLILCVILCSVLTVCHCGVLRTRVVVADSGLPPGVCKRSADATSGQDNAHAAPTLPPALWSDSGITPTTPTHKRDRHKNQIMITVPLCFIPLLFLSFSDPFPTGSDGLLLKPEANPLHLSSCDTETKRRAERQREKETEENYIWREKV